jgi:hypothetical protein
VQNDFETGERYHRLFDLAKEPDGCRKAGRRSS